MTASDEGGAPAPASLIVQLQTPEGEWVDVGVLARNGETNWFESLPGYWELANRPVLGQVFEERGRTWQPSARVALPTWFSHLLPEGRLRQAVAEAANVNSQREFFLLSRIGSHDLPGAIRVVPAATNTAVTQPTTPEPAADDPDGDFAVLKFSLAGVQLKFSVLDAGERGLTIPARGQAGDWIAKLPDWRPGFESVPEAEFAALEFARAAGILTPEVRLVDVTDIAGLPDWATAPGGKALLVRRFDRTSGGQRVHAEELAQVLDVPTGHERFKYQRANFESVGTVTAALCGPPSVGEVIDRIVCNVLVGNGDAHTKNWAYVYPDGQHAVLSPAYDIVPTVLYIPGDDLGMNLNGSRAFEDVRKQSFDRLATRAGWSSGEARQRAADAVGKLVSAWGVLDASLPKPLASRLAQRRDALPLLRS